MAAAASAAIVTGVSGGKLGQILKAGVIVGATAFAFNEVGNLTVTPANAAPEIAAANFAENVAGHAAIGCLSAVASGGQCGPGALSGAAGSAAAPFVQGDLFARTAEMRYSESAFRLSYPRMRSFSHSVVPKKNMIFTDDV